LMLRVIVYSYRQNKIMLVCVRKHKIVGEQI
jgi:hypothetical protein